MTRAARDSRRPFEAARSADVVILFLGEGGSMSGEASSRAYLNLPGAQEQLAAEVAKAGKPMIAVIMAGRPLTFHEPRPENERGSLGLAPRKQGGPAIVDTIFGDFRPFGKIDRHIPQNHRASSDLLQPHEHRPPGSETGPYADEKFTSKYIDERFTPEYPFGYGLSYTTFKYSNLRLSSPS